MLSGWFMGLTFFVFAWPPQRLTVRKYCKSQAAKHTVPFECKLLKVPQGYTPRISPWVPWGSPNSCVRHSFTNSPLTVLFKGILIAVCMCGFIHTASQLLSLNRFPSLFHLSLSAFFSTHSPQFTSALVLLFSLFLSFLFLCPSWPPYGSILPVRLLLTNEATAWPQAAVHQGHDSWGPSRSNDTKALSSYRSPILPVHPWISFAQEPSECQSQERWLNSLFGSEYSRPVCRVSLKKDCSVNER